MADIQFSVALEGIATLQAQLNNLRGEVEKASGAAQKSLGGISDFFVQSLKQSSPLVGRAVEAFTNPIQAGVQILADGVSAIGGWITAADEAAKVEAQLAARIKSTGGAAGLTQKELIAMAESLAEVTLFEDDAIKSSEALLLTFTGIGKDIFPQVQQAVLDLSTAFGQDLKSSSIQLGKAMQDPIAGATALRRVGVQLTDQQEAQIKAFVEAGDVAKAQAIILKELAVETGGAAKAAAESGSGQWQQFKKQLGEVGESIGAVLIPVLNLLGKALGAIVKFVSNVVSAFKTLLENNPAILFTGLAVALNFLIPVMASATVGFIAMMAPIVVAAAPFIALGAAIVGVGLAAKALVGAIGSAVEAVGEFFTAEIQLPEELLKANGAITDQTETVNKASYAVQFWKDALADLSREIKEDAVKAIQSLNDRIKNHSASITELNARMTELKKSYEAATDPKIRSGFADQIIELEAQIKAIDILEQKHEALRKELENQKAIAKELSKAHAAIENFKPASLFDDAAIKKTEEALDIMDGTFGSERAPLVDNIKVGIAAMQELGVTTEKAFSPQLVEDWEAHINKAGKGVQFVEGQLDKLYLQLQAIEEAFTALGKSITSNVAHAFGDLAFQMGQALNQGRNLKVVFLDFISSLIEQIGKLIGTALINMALGAGFPLGIPFLIAGLAVLGLSGILSSGVKKGADKNRRADQAMDMTQSQSQQPSNAPGLSSFNEDAFTPTINIDAPATLIIGDQPFDAWLTTSQDKKRRRKGG